MDSVIYVGKDTLDPLHTLYGPLVSKEMGRKTRPASSSLGSIPICIPYLAYYDGDRVMEKFFTRQVARWSVRRTTIFYCQLIQ